jgi:hypothetical protein
VVDDRHSLESNHSLVPSQIISIVIMVTKLIDTSSFSKNDKIDMFPYDVKSSIDQKYDVMYFLQGIRYGSHYRDIIIEQIKHIYHHDFVSID